MKNLPGVGNDFAYLESTGTRPVSRRFHLTRSVSLAVLSAALLGACTMRPEPITQAQHFERAQQDYKALYADYVPLTGSLTLSDAIARSLKYNYDAQLAKTEMTLQERQLDLAMAQMLPRVAANAGYSWRNNDNAAESVSELTKQQSLQYSFSEQPAHTTAGLELSWNMLDLGVSYFQAKQQGYRTFVAVERRRKVIDGIVKGVQEAYWKAVAADRLLPRLNPLLADAQRILDASREASAKKLEPALQALDFQQNMLQVIGQLEHMKTDLDSARIQLASLIAVPVDTPFALAGMNVALQPPSGPVDPRKLEALGLALRPELREEAYQEKIDQQDVYKEMIKMMPGIGLLGSINYDTNKYLFNPSWGQLGAQATFNLVNLIEGPKAIEAAETSVEVSRTRRLALSVAILTQVNLSYQEFLAASQDLSISKQIDDVQQQIHVASSNASAAKAQSDADRVRRELATMVAELGYDRAIAQVHTALVNLYTAVGVDLVPPSYETDDLADLSQHVSGAIAGWEAGKLPDVELPATDPAPAGDDEQPTATSDAPPVTTVANQQNSPRIVE